MARSTYGDIETYAVRVNIQISCRASGFTHGQRVVGLLAIFSGIPRFSNECNAIGQHESIDLDRL